MLPGPPPPHIQTQWESGESCQLCWEVLVHTAGSSCVFLSPFLWVQRGLANFESTVWSLEGGATCLGNKLSMIQGTEMAGEQQKDLGVKGPQGRVTRFLKPPRGLMTQSLGPAARSPALCDAVLPEEARKIQSCFTCRRPG